MTKYTAKQAAEAQRLYKETNMTLRQIAEATGINPHSVHGVIHPEYRSAQVRASYQRRKAQGVVTG